MLQAAEPDTLQYIRKKLGIVCEEIISYPYIMLNKL